MAKILIVEDEGLVRILIVETLKEAGHDVLEAPDGEAALALLQQHADVDLIVTDVRMAKLDGFALAIAAKRLRQGLEVVFITGYIGTEVPRELSRALVMQKPFDPDALVVAIGTLLAERGSPAAA
jgi:CheY-like chemotaxis protein